MQDMGYKAVQILIFTLYKVRMKEIETVSFTTLEYTFRDHRENKN